MTLNRFEAGREVGSGAGLPPKQARDMVTALAEEVRDELATKEFVRAELANLR
jgi:hypothetical protein